MAHMDHGHNNMNDIVYCNLYKFHTNPEQLYGYEDRLLIPGLALPELREKIKDVIYDEDSIEKLIDIYLPHIATDPQQAYLFASEFTGRNERYVNWGRLIAKVEPYLIHSPQWIFHYSEGIIGGRWEEAEPVIMKDPKWANEYVLSVIGERWHEAEPYIMQDTKTAVSYAENVIKGRWEEAEPSMAKHSKGNHQELLNYGEKYVREKWPVAEKVFINNPRAIVWYARDTLGHRWEEAEPMITDEFWWDAYKKIFKL